jgi:PAS domain S-box-containing protein
MKINAVLAARGQAGIEAGIVDAIQEAVIATDLEGRIIFWNSFAETLYGWGRTEAVGRDVLDLILPATSREKASELMRRVLLGESWAGTLMLQHRDGHEFAGQVSDAPLRDDRTTFGIICFSVAAQPEAHPQPAGGSAEPQPENGLGWQLVVLTLVMATLATALSLIRLLHPG